MSEPNLHAGFGPESRSLRPVFLRWGAVALALVAELLAFTLWFPVHHLIEAAGLGSMALNRSMLTPRLVASGLLTAAVATALFGANRLAAWLRAEDRSRWFRGPGAIACPVGHALAFASFLAISSRLMDIPRAGPGLDRLTAPAWVFSGAGSVLLALASALPVTRWWSLIRAIPRAIVAGVAVGLATPAASVGTTALWSSLGRWTLVVVAAMLRLVAPEVESGPGPSVIGAGGFAVDVSPECSGYEGIGLVLAFLAGFLWYDRKRLRFPVALALLPLGAVAIWVCNALRITALILIGVHGYPRLAVEGFHSQAGSIGFVAISMGLAWLSRAGVFRARDHAPTEADAVDDAPINPVTPYLLPQLAIIAASMLGGIFLIGDGLDRGYPLRVVAALAAFAWCRRAYRPGPWPGMLSWVGPASGVLVFAIWMALEPSLSPTGPPDALLALPKWLAWGWVACRVVGSVVLVPVAEELAFRGFLARRVMASDFESVPARRLSWLAIAVSTAAFAALHGRWLAGGVAGLIYALTYRHRGRLADAAIAHATTNALIALYVLSAGVWSLW